MRMVKKPIHYWVIPGVKKKAREIFIWEVIREVAEWEGMSVEDVKIRKDKKTTHLRYVVMYLMEKYGRMRQYEISEYLGYKDRMSVVVANKWVRDRLAWDGELRDCVEWVEMRLMGWEKKDISFKSRRSG